MFKKYFTYLIILMLFIGFIAFAYHKESSFGLEKEFADNWSGNRENIIVSVEDAILKGDHEKALLLALPYESLNDPKIDSLLLQAWDLEDVKKEEYLALKKAEKEKERLKLVATATKNIRESSGAERVLHLQKLIQIDPNNKEFFVEISKIKKELEHLETQKTEFLNKGVGKVVPAEKWGVLGEPETLDATDEEYWVAYLPKSNLSFVAQRDTNKVLFVGRSRLSVQAFLLERNKELKRKALEKYEARLLQIKKGFSGLDGSHIKLGTFIKSSMNDPDSYKHVKTVYRDNGDHLIVTTTFRGKNAFGGVITNWVEAKTDIFGNIIEILVPNN